MSLINKMLQDLDARGTPAGPSFPSNVTPVAVERRTPSLRLAGAGAALVVVVVVALGWFGWHRLHAAQPGQGAAMTAASKPVALKPAQGLNGTIVPAPAAPNAPAAKIAPPGAVEAQVAAPVLAAPAPAPAQPDASPADAAPELSPKHAHKRHADAATPAKSAAVRSRSVPPMEPDSAEARQARYAAAIELATRETRMARLAKAKGKADTEGLQEPTAQRAENEYRRALASLQEGRMAEAIASLQLALRVDPGHDAARQTLVGLLVESGRGDEAMRELQLGLARDPRQPALAMLLARLQIEHGGSGIEVLLRTLPYATGSGDYQAFLGGALQRQGRFREAAEQYQTALRTSPGNAVWWMGLGIALQGDKRNAEAADAFRQAKALGSLSPELQAFVERRLGQLGR